MYRRRLPSLLALTALLSLAPAAQAASPELDRAQREVERLEKDESQPSESRAQLLEIWRETVQALREEARWRAQAEEFESLREQAPTRLKQLRADLVKAPAAPPLPEATGDLAALEQALAQARAQLATGEQTVNDLQAERRVRTDRRLALPGEISRAQQQVDALAAATAASPGVDETPSLSEARRARAEARSRSLQAELQARQAELSSYDARSELLTLRQDLAVRRANETSQVVEELARRLDGRRTELAANAATQAEAERRRLAAAPAPVRELALGNEELADERRRLVESIQEAARLTQSARGEAESIEQRSRSVRRKVEAAQFTKPVALLMRRHQAELPDVGRHRARLRGLGRDTSRLLARQLDVEDERSALTDLGTAKSERLASVDELPADEEARNELSETLQGLLEQRRELLDDLYQEQGAYLTQLAELDTAERRLIQVTETYGAFIAEHLLWLRGSPAVGPRDLVDSARALAWLSAPKAWGELSAELGRHALERPTSLLLGLLAVVLVVLRRSALRRVTEIGQALGRSRRHRFRQTVEALALTLFASAAWPAALWWLSDITAAAAAETRLGLPMSAALLRFAQLLLPTLLLADAFRPQGLAHAHFRWPGPLLEEVRRRWWILAFVAVPAFALESLLDAQERPELRDSLGRLALVAGLLALAWFLHRTLDPALRPAAVAGRRLRWVHRAAPAAAVALAVAALAGYFFAARELGATLLETYALLFGVALAHAVARRWLVVERRRLRLEALRRQAQDDASEPSSDAALDSAVPAESEELDLDAVDSQTRQLLRAAVVVTIGLCLWGLWAELLPATRAADRVVLWTTGTSETAASPLPALPGTTSAQPAPTPAAPQGEPALASGAVTLTDVLLALVVTIMAVFAAGNVPGLLEITLLRRLDLAPGTGYAVTTLTRYAITIVGVIATAGLLGLAWNNVQWLAAAVTVGLGFGLQEIFANFVSGLIILFEKPIRVGDVVTVGNIEGQVTKIRTRATTISDWDRRELLVPNREFITGQLINWTLTDPVTRVVIPVGIAYGSDTRLATARLLEVAQQSPYVLADPKPSVVFRAFGESSLDFQLRVFIPRRDVWPQLMHELHLAIDDAFRQENIEIAFPQRDIHVRTLPERLAARAEDPA